MHEYEDGPGATTRKAFDKLLTGDGDSESKELGALIEKSDLRHFFQAAMNGALPNGAEKELLDAFGTRRVSGSAGVIPMQLFAPLLAPEGV